MADKTPNRDNAKQTVNQARTAANKARRAQKYANPKRVNPLGNRQLRRASDPQVRERAESREQSE